MSFNSSQSSDISSLDNEGRSSVQQSYITTPVEPKCSESCSVKDSIVPPVVDSSHKEYQIKSKGQNKHKNHELIKQPDFMETKSKSKTSLKSAKKCTTLDTRLSHRYIRLLNNLFQKDKNLKKDIVALLSKHNLYLTRKKYMIYALHALMLLSIFLFKILFLVGMISLVLYVVINKFLVLKIKFAFLNLVISSALFATCIYMIFKAMFTVLVFFADVFVYKCVSSINHNDAMLIQSVQNTTRGVLVLYKVLSICFLSCIILITIDLYMQSYMNMSVFRYDWIYLNVIVLFVLLSVVLFEIIEFVFNVLLFSAFEVIDKCSDKYIFQQFCKNALEMDCADVWHYMTVVLLSEVNMGYKLEYHENDSDKFTQEDFYYVLNILRSMTTSVNKLNRSTLLAQLELELSSSVNFTSQDARVYAQYVPALNLKDICFQNDIIRCANSALFSGSFSIASLFFSGQIVPTIGLISGAYSTDVAVEEDIKMFLG